MNNCLKHIFKNSKKKCKYDDLQLMTTQPTNILVWSDRGRTRKIVVASLPPSSCDLLDNEKISVQNCITLRTKIINS